MVNFFSGKGPTRRGGGAVGPRRGEELHAAGVEGRGGVVVGPCGGEELRAAGGEGRGGGRRGGEELRRPA